MDIGKRIRQLRIRNGLTQQELASRCELTKGFLSQLENDLATPSLPALMDIVEALGSDMATFFSEDREQKTVFRKDDFFHDDKGGYEISWVVPNAQKNMMEPIVLTVRPGQASQTMEPHSGEEFGLVLSGALTLVNAGKEQKLRRGDTFYIRGDGEHRLENRSPTSAQVLWITTPPLF